MYRTRRNENAVDEDVDHEPATCKAELTVPNQYSKVPSFICAVHLVTDDCMMAVV